MTSDWKPAFLIAGLLAAASQPATADDLFGSGKLLATPGVIQAEGAGGAGLAAWATISGYGTDREIGANAHYTLVALDDFTFQSAGVTVGLFDRVELSFAKQWFDTGSAGGRLGLGDGFNFNQDVVGAKVRLFGDAVYDQDTWMPQVAAGIMYKKADKGDIVRYVGAKDDDGVDFYVAATKILLNESLVLSAGARLTEANHFGLVGFGGPNGDHSLQFEGSAVYLVDEGWLIGADYRTKPDNLAFAEEGNAWAAYGVWMPNKHISVTLGYADLGPIALQGRQNGLYLSLQTGF
ncbi:MAG: DUF3034 family protein [Alphaproteobacteria bacterium]|nr:MAG: DUF3034 family protein [Alphaproteobacteria bacterium]